MVRSNRVLSGVREVAMDGKTCLVTGATSGIGRGVAEELARLGATVIVVGRGRDRSVAIVDRIRRATSNANVEFMLADLSSQREVRTLAEEFLSRHRRLDVLVNNVGAIVLRRKRSVDGIEMTLALNHLGYFLLTDLLLDVLRSSAPARVVNVSSAAHESARLDFDDLENRRRYGGYKAYSRSKLANVLFTYELARRLDGTGVTANALHPGLVATRLAANNGLPGVLVNLLIRVGGMSPLKGARTVVYLAASPEVDGVSGRYFVNERSVPSSEASRDTDDARRLWEISSEMTGLG